MISFLKKILPNFLKEALKNEIIRIVDGHCQDRTNDLAHEFSNFQSHANDIENKINILNEQFHLKTLLAPSISKWHEPIIYEASVNLALRDICKPGDVVFDVGSNEGGLTLLMSRLVGPKGIVCAFEANPYILDLCTHNLVRNGCNNFFINHACVWKKSHQVLNFYIPQNNWNAASLYQGQGSDRINVQTIALDDYINSIKLLPNLIKMDIEGAEFDALEGTKKYISQKQPHLILEQWTNDERCLEFLKNQGYIAIDLNNYKLLESVNDYPEYSQIRNVLFIHRDRVQETPYNINIKTEEIGYYGSTNFNVDQKEFILNNFIDIKEGRYILRIDFEADTEENTMFLGIYVNDIPRIIHIANANFLKRSYRDCALHVKESDVIKVDIKFLNDTFDPTFYLKGISCSRVINFDSKSSFTA